MTVSVPPPPATARDWAIDRVPLRLPDRLVHHARQLLALTRPADILARTLDEALHISDGTAAFASYSLPGQSWNRSLHVATPAHDADVPANVVSALFAMHRRVSMARAVVVVTHEDQPTIVDALATGASSPIVQVVAIPMWSRTRRLMGELTIALPTLVPMRTEALSVIDELNHLAVTALENAQRVAFARRDQERLNLLAEASDEALWDWNLDTDEYWWGGGVQRLLGDGDKVVQHRAEWKYDRIHPDDRERIRMSFQRARDARATSSWVEEYRVLRTDGDCLVVQDHAYFLRETAGRAFRAVGAVRDITALKQLLESEQAARADAETASRAKDDFLAMLGHELRNPLAPILTATELLRHKGGAPIERERRIIERQTQQLVRLVDDLLDVSRVASGKIELHRERLDLSEVVTEAIDMSRYAVEERRHQLSVDVEPGIVIHADRARFAQVVCNLLTNAAKYTEVGGRIRLVAGRADDKAEVSVIDNGIGIEPEMLASVFDLFVQERQALDRSRGGLGLGLSIVRSLVTLHGGSVTADSEGRGRGSRFTVRVPLAADRTTGNGGNGHKEHSDLHESGRRMRVLILDDNEDAAEMLTVFMRHMGYETAKEHDGWSALTLVRSFLPDVVLLDVGLPGMNGYEVARELRKMPEGKNACLIAVTGYGQESDRKRALSAGFDAHVVKPVSMAHLHQLMLDLTGAQQP